MSKKEFKATCWGFNGGIRRITAIATAGHAILILQWALRTLNLPPCGFVRDFAGVAADARGKLGFLDEKALLIVMLAGTIAP